MGKRAMKMESVYVIVPCFFVSSTRSRSLALCKVSFAFMIRPIARSVAIFNIYGGGGFLGRRWDLCVLRFIRYIGSGRKSYGNFLDGS